MTLYFSPARYRNGEVNKVVESTFLSLTGHLLVIGEGEFTVLVAGNIYHQCCGSASLWSGSGFSLSLWFWSGSRSCLSLWCGSRSYLHFDADPDPNPDPSFSRLKTLEKCSNRLIYILACHLQTDADPNPDPAYHFDADPDLDSAYQFWCGSYLSIW